MKNTGYLYDDRYLLHNTGPYHPEVPERLSVINKGLKDSSLLNNLLLIKAVEVNLKWIESVHDRSYIEHFKKACILGSSVFTCSDNVICENSYKVASLAVGGILEVVDKLMEGEVDNAFCAVRPPGHHAEYNQAMGFCYFNNVAIAAQYLKKKWNIERVGIIDFDVHHGNGTQNIFEEDPNVFYYSIHQHPAFSFPGTGSNLDVGVRQGLGFTKNSLILPGQGDIAYREMIEKDLLPAFKSFKPQVIVVSTGFDAHVDDSISNTNLSTEGLSWIMKVIFNLAEQYSNGRLISVLEGGYNLERLPELTVNHVQILLDA